MSRQVANDQRHMANLEAKIKAYLKAGDRETAGRFALELQKARTELKENEAQLEMHEKAYDNNVTQDQDMPARNWPVSARRSPSTTRN